MVDVLESKWMALVTKPGLLKLLDPQIYMISESVDRWGSGPLSGDTPVESEYIQLGPPNNMNSHSSGEKQCIFIVLDMISLVVINGHDTSVTTIRWNSKISGRTTVLASRNCFHLRYPLVNQQDYTKS